jgi:hypothetical protein
LYTERKRGVRYAHICWAKQKDKSLTILFEHLIIILGVVAESELQLDTGFCTERSTPLVKTFALSTRKVYAS